MAEVVALVAIVSDRPHVIAGAAVEVPYGVAGFDDVLETDESDFVAARTFGSVGHGTA
jgi:hypothetical protein